MTAFAPSTVSSFNPLNSFVSFRTPTTFHSPTVARAHVDRPISKHLVFPSPLELPKHPAGPASRIVRGAADAARRTASAALTSGLAGGIWVGAVRAGTVPLGRTEPLFAAIVLLIKGFEDLVPAALDATYDDTGRVRLLLKLLQCVIMLSPY
eukprot:CAMPEP_0174889318 /NCGR_PEP_ID=MMETSP0167-20121228/4584_1 /TAXON_ID=38298 /ORGANISM="Rhodella maculata, Strain CCMP736" /LENGTH=151 /DNA_ID=CAMNT_0016126685 /DNA_START=190 /DNA_END=645 /DNA_ORIENTATION=+